MIDLNKPWSVAEMTADEFLVFMASLGTPQEIQLVGSFAPAEDQTVRTAHRDIDLPPHRDGIYTQAIADMQGGMYVTAPKPPDVVGMYCIRANGRDEPCQTVFYEDESGTVELGRITLQPGQAVVWRNSLYHGRKGPVGERLLIRFWSQQFKPCTARRMTTRRASNRTAAPSHERQERGGSVKLTTKLDLVLEDLLRFSHHLDGLLDKLDDADPAQPPASSYAPVRNLGPVSELWCDHHDRAQHDCELDGELCVGVPVSIHDMTGEAALTYSDHPAVRDQRQVERDIATLAAVRDRLLRIAMSWESRSPTVKEQRETASSNVPGCELHALVGSHVDQEPGAGLVSVAGGWPLPRPMRLCSACRQRIARTHRLPSKADLRHHADHALWPRMLDVNYRAG